MSERVLALVEPAREVRLAAALPVGIDLVATASEAELLELLGSDPVPLLVLLAPAGGERAVRDLLDRLRPHAPGPPRVLWLAEDRSSLVADALQSGGLVGLVPAGADDTALAETLRHALRAAEHGRLERASIERMQFAQEVLGETIQSLEQRVDRAHETALSIERLVAELRGARSLHALARTATEAVSGCLRGRGVRMALVRPSRGLTVEASAGAPGSQPVARVALHTGELELGVLEVLALAAREGSADELTPEEHARLVACEGAIVLAAQGILHRAERDEAQLATVQGLARLAEHRDDTTGRHLERVSVFSRLIAEGLRDVGMHPDVLNARYLDDIELSAPLHDIGKVAVPDAILLKPGKLDPGEWEVMKRHAEIGARTLSTILESSGEQGYLRMGHEIAWCHHERWDGAGYPRGLRGAEIPLAARVMMVADVYDALTSQRPYKPAWTHDRALAHIITQAGKHFDPEVVAAFVRRAGDLDQERRRLTDPLSGVPAV